MIPKIASALARVLDPIKPIQRPGATLSTAKSAEGGDGGHGALGYAPLENPPEDPPEEEQKAQNPEAGNSESAAPIDGKERETDAHLNDPEPETASLLKKKGPSLPLQPGLTQVILDVSSARQERQAAGVSGSSPSNLTSYETSAKEQKKASRLPKGSMLDKKAG